MGKAVDQLWDTATNRPYVDAVDLWQSLRAVADEGEVLDARSKLLVRDSLAALQARRPTLPAGADPAVLARLTAISASAADDFGFPSIGERLMNATSPQTILAMFRELGRTVRTPTSIAVGGSTGLILRGLLRRSTEDVNVVDEVPKALRDNDDVLHDLANRYGVALTHFQSHYLPDGWQSRLEPLDQFGELAVSLVHALDIAVGKVFSRRGKDRDDLRVILPVLGVDAVRQHLASTTRSFRSEPALEAIAQENWYILTGEKELPALLTLD